MCNASASQVINTLAIHTLNQLNLTESPHHYLTYFLLLHRFRIKPARVRLPSKNKFIADVLCFWHCKQLSIFRLNSTAKNCSSHHYRVKLYIDHLCLKLSHQDVPSKPSFNSQIHYVAIASEALLSVTHHAILNLMHERGGVNGTSILDDLLPLVDALSSSTIEYCRISLSESVSLSPVKLKQLRSYPLLKPDPSKEVSRIGNYTQSPCYSRTNTTFACMQLSRLI